MKILLIEDHALVRDGLARLLTTFAGAEIVEAGSGREGLAKARIQGFDVIILDLNLPELGGLELLARLRQLGPSPVLVLSMHAEPLYVSRALDGGAQGYVSKNASPEELLTAIRRVAAGGRYVETDLAQTLAVKPGARASLDQLSPRDLEIVRLLAGGRSLSEIAGALGLSYKTVANTCTHIKSKLGVSRTADLLRLALEAGVP